MLNLNDVFNKIRNADRPLKIDFSKYQLDDEDIKALARVLKETDKVISLNFSGQKIAIEPLKELCNALRKTKCVRALDFSGCELGGCFSLSFLIQNSDVLETISFEKTIVKGYSSDDCILNFFPEAKLSKSLRCVNFKGQSISSKTAKFIIDQLKSDVCSIVEFYADVLDTLPEVRDALEKNKARLLSEGKILPMQGIENEPEYKNVVMVEKIADGLFSEVLGVHGIFEQQIVGALPAEALVEKDEFKPK